MLAYAAGGDHPLREPRRRVVETIQEFVHVRARWRDRGEAAERGRKRSACWAPDRRLGMREAAGRSDGSVVVLLSLPLVRLVLLVLLAFLALVLLVVVGRALRLPGRLGRGSFALVLG